jgi:hypothetical protein
VLINLKFFGQSDSEDHPVKIVTRRVPSTSLFRVDSGDEAGKKRQKSEKNHAGGALPGLNPVMVAIAIRNALQ